MTRARDLSNLIGSGNFSSTTFTATAGQTVFTIAHTQGFIQVFMNGLLLDLTTDYTSNGSAITLTSAAAAGDEIEVVKYNTFSVGDAVPASGGTFTGSIDASAGLTTPAGHVIQMQHSSITGNNTGATVSSFTDTGLSVNITPKFATSKILVIVNVVIGITRSTHARIDFRCIENGSSTEVIRYDYTGIQGSSASLIPPQISGSGVFQCSDTSQLTFKAQVQRAQGAANEAGLIYLKWYSGGSHTIQALEIAQ